MMLSRWIVLLLLLGVSGCSGLKLQLEVQRGNQTMMTSAQQALGLKDRVALHLQVPQDSFVYLAHSPVQRDTRPIYPVTGPLRLTAGKLHRVPEDGSFLPLDDIQPGESLCVILSPHEIKGTMPRCVSPGGSSRDGTCGKDCEPKKTNPKDRAPGGVTIVPLHLSQCIPAIHGAEPQRRALLIGIDHYLPPRGSLQEGVVTDLQGARNDVELVAKVLRSRFNFADHELCILRDEEATRAGILQAIQSFLIAPTRQGDQVFLYFAGHGSTFENKLSPDGRDETIVPADRNRQVPDIHDKELHRLLGQVLDRGGELIAAFDSCYSGTVTMDATGKSSQSGQSDLVHIRAAEPVRIPVQTLPPLPTPLTARGAVILGAADSSQRAQERQFGNRFQGIFTVGLVRALYLSQPGDSVATLMRSAMAFVRASALGNEQQPKLEASPERGRRPLFGGSVAAQDGASVMVVNKSPDGILLGEGLGLGIGVGARLERPGPKKLVLTVEQVLDLSSSLARVVDGDADSLQVGEPLRVVHFGTSSQKSLRIALGEPVPAGRDLSPTAQALTPLLSRTGAHLTLDEEREPPTHRLRYGRSGWQLTTLQDKRSIELGEQVTTQTLLGRLPSSAVLAVDWPLDAAAVKRLGDELLSQSIQLVEESEAHDYVVRGRLGKSPVFALLQPTPGANVTMPPRSKWVIAEELAEQARKLMRQFRWLTLEGQPEDVRDFPYQLEVADMKVPGRVLHAGDTTHNQEQYMLWLVHPEQTPSRTVEPRYVYVCSVDSRGSMALLFGGSSDKNRLPIENYTRQRMELLSFHPFGERSIDTFVLLTSSQALSEPEKICSEQTHMAGCEVSSDATLCALLQGGLLQGTAQHVKPGRWSVQRITVEHHP
jgi:hypothetical protein